MATARPKKKKIIGIIIIILLAAQNELANGNADSLRERMGNALGRVLSYDEDFAEGVYTAAEALADAADPEAVSQATTDDLETLLAILEGWLNQ